MLKQKKSKNRRKKRKVFDKLKRNVLPMMDWRDGGRRRALDHAWDNTEKIQLFLLEKIK